MFVSLFFDPAQVKAAHESPRLTLTCSSPVVEQSRGETLSATEKGPEHFFGYQVWSTSDPEGDNSFATPFQAITPMTEKRAPKKTGRIRKIGRSEEDQENSQKRNETKGPPSLYY